MMAVSSDLLVTFDGTLGSIVACTTARFAPDAAGRLFVCGRPSIEAEWSGFLDQFGGEWTANKAAGVNEGDSSQNLSLGLLAAALQAADRGVGRVVWPIHAGVEGKPGEMDLDAASSHIDRALLVTRLASMDAASHKCASISVETPYADFSDRQIAELALDMGVPFRKALWWGDDSSAEFVRWRGVFDAIGSAVTT